MLFQVLSQPMAIAMCVVLLSQLSQTVITRQYYKVSDNHYDEGITLTVIMYIMQIIKLFFSNGPQL